MIDILDTTGTDTCRNCGNKIVRLSGSMTEEHWSHLPLGENKGRFVVHCPGAPVAEPRGEGPLNDRLLHISDRTDGDASPLCWHEYAGHESPCVLAGPGRWASA